MEAASLTFSIVSLLDTCLTAGRLYSTGKTFSPDSQSLALELLWQQSRLKSWAKLWQIPLDDGFGGVNTASPAAATLLEREAREAQIDLYVVERTLKSMHELLSEGEQLSNCHLIETLTPDKDGPMPDRAKDAWRRVRWAVVDMIRLSKVVASLRTHNDDLWRMKPRGDISSPATNQTAAVCESLATASALGLSLPQSPGDGSLPEFEQAVSMIRRHEAAENTFGAEPDVDLAFHEWRGHVRGYGEAAEAIRELSGLSGGRQIALYSKGNGRFQQLLDVMVEWKPYGPTTAAQLLALERTDRVARLLSAASLPEELRVLRCVGYFQVAHQSCCGILFELPPCLTGRGKDVEIVTLAEELCSPAYRSTGGPLLTERFHLAWMLARAVLTFHLFRWLHKDIRSANVVFFRLRGEGSVDLRAPYMASFGLARPDQRLLPSESCHGVDGDNAELMPAYGHPEYQWPLEREQNENGSEVDQVERGSPRRRYHRAFDVYSLGCVLLEIGLWRSLRSMRWEQFRHRRAEWRERLVQYAEERLGFLCGPAYRDIVVRCLRATVEEEGEGENERVRDFCWTVVRVLENLRV